MSTNSKVIEQLLFEPTYECNLRCKYCYLGEKRTKPVKTDYAYALNSARELVEKIKSEGYTVHNVLYHGAETTMLPPEVLAQICNIFHEVSHPIGFQSVQTNGTRANEEYMAEFERVVNGDVRISWAISIDGPKELNDALRGNGVYDRAMKNAVLLKDRGYMTNLFGCFSQQMMTQLPTMEVWIAGLQVKGINWTFQLAGQPFGLSNEEQVYLAEWLFERDWHVLFNTLPPAMCSSGGNNCATLHFSADGSFAPCSREGNMPSAPSWKPISLSKAINLREGYYVGTPTADKCAYCPILSVCNSGCPLFRVGGVAIDCMLRRTIYELEAKRRGVPIRNVLNIYKQTVGGFRHRTLPKKISEIIAENAQ